jgi:hypothetical protein
MSGWRDAWRRFDAWTANGASGVGDETAAFLDGRLVPCLRATSGSTQPQPWMWLNAAAHGDLVRVTTVACSGSGQESRGWPRAEAHVASILLRAAAGDARELRRLQQDVLIPLEFSLGPVTGLTPDGLVSTVARELELAQR